MSDGGPTLRVYMDHRHCGVTRCVVPSDPAVPLSGPITIQDNGTTMSATESTTQKAKEGPVGREVDVDPFCEFDVDPFCEPTLTLQGRSCRSSEDSDDDDDPMCDNLCFLF